jgi:6-phosphogluconolactonase
MLINKEIFTNDADQIAILVETLTQKINTILQTKPEVVLAVSGGKSPINLFQALSKCDLDWSKIIITLVDERIIDINNENSNQKLVKDNLLINNAKSSQFIGLVNLNLTISQMLIQAQHIPNIDIAILGMGEDGHTASLFPDCDELTLAIDESYPYKYIITTPKNNQFVRIGLCLKAIKEIPYKYIVIKGSNKIKVLEQALTQKDISIPISHLLDDKTQNIHIFKSY